MNTPSPSPAPKRRFRWRRTSSILLAIGVVFIALGFFGLPPIVRTQAEKRLSAYFQRPVKIDRVRIDPLRLSAQIDGLAIGDGQGGTFVGWRRLYVNFDLLARFTGAWTFEEIELDGFTASISRDAKGVLNFADVIDRASAAPKVKNEKDRRGPSLAIDQLIVRSAQVQFRDISQGTPFATDVGPVTFTLRRFRTKGDATAPHAFSAVTEAGETVTWSGSLSLDPIRSVGEFTVSNVSLAKYAPYYQDHVNAVLRRGTLSVGGRYEAEYADRTPALKLIDGGVTIRDLQVSPRNSAEPRIVLNEIALSGIQADLATQQATVDRIFVNGGRIAIDRTKEGIDLLSLFAVADIGAPRPLATKPAPTYPPTPPAGSAPLPPAPSPPVTGPASVAPQLTLNEFAVEGLAVAFTDRTLPDPAFVEIERVSLALKGLKSHALAQPSALEAKIVLAGGGELAATGTVTPQPLEATLALKVSGLPLSLGSPYLESASGVSVAKGTLAIEGDFALVGGAATFTGRTAIEEFAALNSKSKETLAGWSSLDLRGIKVVSNPLSAAVEEIVWSDLVAHAVIQPDGKLNLTSVATPTGGSAQPGLPGATPPPPSAKTTPAAQKATAPLPPLSIGKIVFERARFTFADRSIQPVVESTLSKLEGTISGLSSTNVARGDVQLKGVVNETALVEIGGRLNPLGTPAFADVKIDFKNMELSPLAPYVAKYVGYSLERGALSLAIQFKLNERKIDSSDVATLDQFTLGEKNDSPDAVKLPITLAIALLKDRSGRIVIDVPIQGSLDDPNFRIGRVVWRVLGNLIAKAATSPFALLGSMFGGGGEELAFQAFAAGEAVPLEGEAKKLATVTQALANRPALRLDLAGSFDPVADRAALQRIEVENRLRTAAGQERREGSPSTPGELVLTDADRARLLAKLYAAAFPESVVGGNAQASSSAESAATAPPMAQARPPEKEGGFLQRVRRFFFRRDGEANSATGSSPTPAATVTAGKGDEATGALSVPTPSPLSIQEMTDRLAEKIAIDENELKRLASTRAQRVRAQLLQSGELTPERIFVVTPVSTGSRVELRLK